MKKFLIIFLSLLLFSCGSSNIENPNISDVEVELWESVEDITQISGTWISAHDFKIEFPFELNGKIYLHLSNAQSDDSELWENCASRHFISLNELWNKRFSYLLEIYGKPYPIASSNGVQVGYKFDTSDGKIKSRFEYLIPLEVAQKNLNVFSVSNKGNLKAKGLFQLDSNKIEDFEYLEQSFSKFTDYWN